MAHFWCSWSGNFSNQRRSHRFCGTICIRGPNWWLCWRQRITNMASTSLYVLHNLSDLVKWPLTCQSVCVIWPWTFIEAMLLLTPSVTLFVLKSKIIGEVNTINSFQQWRIQNFKDGVAPTPEIGVPTYHIGKIVAKNWMEMKEIEPRGVLSAPLHWIR